MPRYVLLLTLAPQGREKMLEDPDSLLRAESAIKIPDVQVLGLYGILGDYDFVSILEAPDNESAARFSLELGVRAGIHVATMPIIPIGRLEDANRGDVLGIEPTGAQAIPDYVEDF